MPVDLMELSGALRRAVAERRERGGRLVTQRSARRQRAAERYAGVAAYAWFGDAVADALGEWQADPGAGPGICAASVRIGAGIALGYSEGDDVATVFTVQRSCGECGTVRSTPVYSAAALADALAEAGVAQ